VAGGRSYVSLSLGTAPDARPGATDEQIWVVGVTPGQPFAARCDDGQAAPVTRLDPEVFVGAEQVFVYYFRPRRRLLDEGRRAPEGRRDGRESVCRPVGRGWVGWSGAATGAQRGD